MKRINIIFISVVALLLLFTAVFVYYLNSSSKDNNLQLKQSNQTTINDGLVLVEAGTFTMGSPETEQQRESDEVQHPVTLNSFYFSAYEVTQSEYSDVMETNPSEFSGENLPVENVSWYDAITYCNRLSEKEGLDPVYTIDGENVSWDRQANGYRLPTEAEWEYAARANTATPFNTQTSISDEEANYYGHYPYLIEENYFSQGNLETKPGTYRQKTTDVGSFAPNNWQLYDMHGNVREWCFDYYGDYDLENTENPSGPVTGQLRVTRGGGWNDYAKHLRSAYRSSKVPGQYDSNIGFRVARNVDSTLNDVVDSNGTKLNENEISTEQTLIVYFSWGGNTKEIAELIQEQLDCDIFEIELEDPYSQSYNTVLDQAQKDLNNNARPALSSHVDDISKYDAILLGYPNWWATIPMPIATFIEEYNLDGKTIIPFCSHGGGQLGQSVNDIAKLAPNAMIGEPLSIHYSGDSHLLNDINNWIDENKIIKK